MSRLSFPAVLLCLAAIASGCATGRASDPGPGWPAGRTFLSTAVTENGSPRPLVAGTRIELDFGDGGQLQARGGCNGMVGKGRLDGSTLVISDLSTTDMACAEGRMQQDEWLAGLLNGRPILQLAGNELTLSQGSTVITLLDRTVADPDRPLAGTRWVVDTIFAGSAASSVPSAVAAALTLDPAGTFQATTGCDGGELRGTWIAAGDRLSLTTADNHPCLSGEKNPLDQAVRSALARPLTYQITAARLRLMASDGNGLGLLAAS